MSMMMYWQQQREQLLHAMNDQTSPVEAVQHLRHALMQTEQNALAEMTDDLLRQQAGILMSCLKSSVQLLEAHTALPVRIAKKAEKSNGKWPHLWLVSAAAMLLLLIWSILKSYWGAGILAATALAVGIAAYFFDGKKAYGSIPPDDVQVKICVDSRRLFAIIDSQIRSMDRYLEDFLYLNDQARGNAESADPLLFSRAADLYEALYEHASTEIQAAEEAADNLLSKLGLQAVRYSDENVRLFNTLPSKTATCTISPAIIAADDQRLLKRGTAAVKMDTAC